MARFGGVITIRLMVITFMLVVSGHVVVGQEAVLDFYKNPIKTNTSYIMLDKEGGSITLRRYKDLVSVWSEFKDPHIFKFVSTSEIIKLTTKFNVKSVTPGGGTGLWSATLNKPVFLNGSESGIESIFSLQKSIDSTYKFVSGIGDLQGYIGLRSYGRRGRPKMLVLKRYSTKPLSVNFIEVVN